MTYTMTPIIGGTRLRTDHNTFSAVITSFNADTLLEGAEIWEAPADGNEVKKGDKWMRVLKANGVSLNITGWTALIHKDVPICDNFKEITETVTPPVVPPVSGVPEWFDLVAPDGSKTRYVKA